MKHLVINCDSHVVRYHCYWPIVSDIINVVTHHNIADIFMKDLDLLEKWINFIALITGNIGEGCVYVPCQTLEFVQSCGKCKFMYFTAWFS